MIIDHRSSTAQRSTTEHKAQHTAHSTALCTISWSTALSVPSDRQQAALPQTQCLTALPHTICCPPSDPAVPIPVFLGIAECQRPMAHDLPPFSPFPIFPHLAPFFLPLWCPLATHHPILDDTSGFLGGFTPCFPHFPTYIMKNLHGWPGGSQGLADASSALPCPPRVSPRNGRTMSRGRQ